ncbi:transposable element Tc3 transposase [Trichonephila clavipes]|nr:transposable element Tc3 transposase [Trichonephila clavipes]
MTDHSSTNDMFTSIGTSSPIIPTSSSHSVIQPPSASNIQDTKKISKVRARKRKKEILKKMKDTVFEIKMAQHRPRKPASVEYTTDEEDTIVYDMGEEIESPKNGSTELWFQQDGATCHTACATIDLLKDTFGDRLIPRFGPVNWPPRSCDLTPLDYFLWGYVKSLVYADKPQKLDDLEDNIIRRVIADIRPQMLEKVIENCVTNLYGTLSLTF